MTFVSVSIGEPTKVIQQQSTSARVSNFCLGKAVDHAQHRAYWHRGEVFPTETAANWLNQFMTSCLLTVAKLINKFCGGNGDKRFKEQTLSSVGVAVGCAGLVCCLCLVHWKKKNKNQKACARQSAIDLHPNSLLRKISELSSCHNITAVFASAVMLLDQQ